jgi:hypothetical protein
LGPDASCISVIFGATLALNAQIGSAGSRPIACTVYPALPEQLAPLSKGTCHASQNRSVLRLENGLISVEINGTSGIISKIENKANAEQYPIRDDEAGISFATKTGEKIEWLAREGIRRNFDVKLENSVGESRIALTTEIANEPDLVTLTYSLKKNQFWIERRLSIESAEAKYDQLTYGAANIHGGKINELKLGKFDSPRIISAGKGGIFCGVGWWFYEVENGVYQNTGMNFQTEGRFDAEPWYVGVFQPEAGEPYPGWFWYKTFLSERKLAHDKQRSYSLWNARSGYSFQPINNPDLLNFVGTAKAIGLKGITTGEVRGLAKGTKLAATDPIARKVIDTFAKNNVTFGLHEGSVSATNWQTDAALQKKLNEIDAAAAQGISNLTVDFFKVTDRFADHHRVAEFFRHVREKMDYSECHLGMAAYGPQFQREVILNHPTDLSHFDISRFSADWATLMGFRQSRRGWQEKYQYLMPENGLYYFATHYSNYPRNYEDPERQQFLYIADAWRGLAYAFHDKFGFRDCIAAQSAFSTFYVFGFLDAKIPKADAKFARDYLKWVKANTEILNRSRVCFESEDALVMSKIQNGRGPLFAINYTPGKKQFKMKFALPGNKPVEIRQIYPKRGKAFEVQPGKFLETEIAGEHLAIFEINDGLKGLPPENPDEFSIDVNDWKRAGENFESTFFMPDVRAELAAQKDDTLPKRIASADQVETEIVTTKPAGKSFGKLPREFLDAYGFEEDKYLPTWKAVPWAFADRAWFVYVPANPPQLNEEKPVLILNGKTIPMTPRVRYNPRTRLAHPEKWDAPMWFADITESCNYGGDNKVVLTKIKDAKPGACFIAARVSTKPSRKTSGR